MFSCRRSTNAVLRCVAEPTLEELLSEPIIKALMDADSVDRNELEAMLQSLR
jgi:hypothetical protein